jgi:hypothetical protein
MKAMIALAALGGLMLATAPASAATMSCNGADLQKVNGMMPTMADGQNETTMVKEMAAPNTAMSKRRHEGLRNASQHGRQAQNATPMCC